MNFGNKWLEDKELNLRARDRQKNTIYAVINIEPEPIKNEAGLNFYTYSDNNEQAANDYLEFIKDKIDHITKYNLPDQVQAELDTVKTILNYIVIVKGCEY